MIKYRKGYKYQLAAQAVFSTRIKPDETIHDDFIVLYPSGLCFITSGYSWDGPSGPTFDTLNSMQGSLLHDALYQLMRKELLPGKWRTIADDELGRILKADGMSYLRRSIWVRELKKFGSSAANPANRKKVYIAP